MSATKFFIIGNRVINPKHVAAAERDGNAGKVTVHLVGGLSWTFDRQNEADQIWIQLTRDRGDLTDLRGGPYSITDNEATASEQPR
jgi:hypothetical protein